MTPNLISRILMLHITILTPVYGWSCTDTAATKLSLVSLSQFPQAVCNDGTPAAYYYKEGTDKSLWLVYLAGGDWCYNAESCAKRSHLSSVGNGGFNGTYHTSSSLFPSECGKEGIFDETDGAALASANKVYVPYCSSDAHMGDRAASAETAGWHFRGQQIVSAVLKHAGAGWGDSKIKLVFGGGSAGGRGAMAHLDFVTKSMPSNIEVVGFIDSNMWLDIASWNDEFMGFGAQTEQAYSYANASALVPRDDCGLVYKGSEWKCIFGQYRMPFVSTPYFMAASQYDSWQLRFDVCDDQLGCNISDAAMPYTDDYGVLLQQFMLATPPLRYRKQSAVYSQACYNHHMSESDKFSSVTTSDGLSENDALKVYLKQPEGYQWVDECQGYNCGGGC